MEAGPNSISPILKALRQVEKGTTAEVRVHLSRRWIERDPFARALRIFHHFRMTRTNGRNAVLIYVNTRARKFAILADEGTAAVTESHYWNELGKSLKEDLLSTHPENAIALAVLTVGVTLRQHFPRD